jgi:hypothetical protein
MNIGKGATCLHGNENQNNPFGGMTGANMEPIVGFVKSPPRGTEELSEEHYML